MHEAALSPAQPSTASAWEDEANELRFPSDVRRTVGAGGDSELVAVGRLSGPGEAARLLAAVACLAHRYTHQEAIALRVLDARGSTERSDVVVLPVAAGDSAAACVARAGEQLPQLLPGTLALAQARQTDVIVAFLDGAPTSSWLAGIDYAIAFAFVETAGGFEGWIVYAADAYASATATRIARHLHTLADGIAERSGDAVGQLQLLSDAETRQFLEEWNSPPQKSGSLVHRWVEEQVATRPQAIALRHRDQTLGYAELDARANRLAHWLVSRGAARGSRVAVCVAPSFDIVVAMLAIFKIGAVHVPLDPTYPIDRLSTILAQVAPTIVLHHEEFRDRLAPPGSPAFLAMDAHSGELADLPASTPDVDVSPEDIAYVIYTSGTTGQPKGVMTSHANLTHFVRVAVDRYELNSQDVVPALARFSFSITMFEMFLPLVSGAELWILDRDHVVDFPRLVETLGRVTLVHASPSLLRRLVGYLREFPAPAGSFDGLRHLSSGGDFVSADLLEDLKPLFPQAELFVIYGCSEIACMGCTFFVPRTEALQRSKVGKPFPGVKVRILDARGNLVPIGVAGEIYFAGAGVTPGYLDRPDLTDERYVQLGDARYYRTGDVGRYDAQGNVEILGRSDFQIKLRGMRIELGDIEATLRRAPGVKDAVVTAHTPQGRDKLLVAYLVLGPDGAVPEVRNFVAAQLPEYMVPSAFVPLAALPVNMNLKVDRRALPSPSEADFLRHLTLVPPSNETERKLLLIWQRVLGTTRVGIRDNFFEAGGDSLMALPLMIEIERAFGVTVPMSLLLTDPTIESMARSLTAPAESLRQELVVLRAGSNGSPLFLVHDGEGECLPYRMLAKALPGGRAVYGIQPHGRASYPLLLTRLGDVARRYVEVVRQKQPHGPYFLGGLCIGGFIAFEMARLLREQGEAVDLVALIDVAHVTLPPKSVTKQRVRRLSNSLRGSGTSTDKAVQALRLLGRRALNVAKYETVSRAQRLRNDSLMRLLRFHVDRGLALPRYLADIPVRVVLRFAEREYVTPAPYVGRVVLIRATVKDPTFDGTLIDDTPYVDLFEDPMLGWEGKTTTPLIVHDVPGGHSSMLQEPNVALLARLLESEVTEASRLSKG